MVKCAFKGCGKIQKKYTKESFHRFPVKNGELYKLWLLNAGLDIHTPVEKGLNMRVCSAHFATTDIRKTFCGYSLLKPNAVPSTVQTYSRASDKQVISAVPQSMPVKNTTSTSGQPRTIQPPSSLMKDAEWKEPKWIVNESKLMELFKTCHQCGVFIAEEDRKVTTSGTRIHIEWSCLNNHYGDWESCPQVRGMPENDLLVASSILFVGSTFTEISDWAELINIQIPRKTTFYSLQSTYLIPVIEHAYQEHHEDIMRRMKLLSLGGGISIRGDGRSDCPGFSAKYTTYSFMSDKTKEIIMVDLVQVTEASSSPAMETLGFRRGLDRLLQAGIGVDVLATDRTPSIRKIMRERYPGIEHRLDIWHVAKGIRKKLMAVANDNKNIDLLPWLKSINNHLWWSWQTCGGDSEELKRRWTSILYHICGIHRWEEDGVERTCYHHQLSAEEQRRKKWLPKDSPAFQTLSDHVLDKNLLKDLNHMTLFKHTGDLEAYHSTMLKYTQKRLQFVYNSMKARTLMSVMDYNEKVRRQQARNADGTLRYSLEFPKQTKRLVARGSYEPTTQTFKQTLVERVLERLQDSSVKLAEPDFDFKPPTTVPS
ncbi:uncharacterized protein LOC130916425 isoform X1 [Corythoichthys intestinalis]|uniref:uncharacterized protein LOC130916425 isoform X1 n=1 Tax=Corythoichthys intestinalis TaxID=161448 RepID=UPI0025A565BF|nr:uncharacterized protein LOC130916425 isoform X1 [Corythoichthys intestinalis]